jgi:hypothetical protein
VRADNENNIAKYLTNLQMHKRYHTAERNTQAMATASKSRHHSSATQAVNNR